MHIFTPHRTGLFISRPHRFAVVARDPDTGDEFTAHCPNPGALREFLLPGTPLLFEKAANPNRKLAYTLVGLRYKQSVVPLVSVRANLAARELILPALLPRGEFIPEYTPPELQDKSSRFDFLARTEEGDKILIEVKACSLVEHGVAMFPDAPSHRASRHLSELAHLTTQGYRAMTLFVISHGRPEVFVPHLHSDRLFTSTLYEVHQPRGPVHIHAASLECTSQGEARVDRLSVPIMFPEKSLVEQPRGVLVGFLTEGSEQPAGYGVAVLSAALDLPAKTARWRRVMKQPWMQVYGGPGTEETVTTALLGCRGALAEADYRELPGVGRALVIPWQGPGITDRELLDSLFYIRHRVFVREHCHPD